MTAPNMMLSGVPCLLYNNIMVGATLSAPTAAGSSVYNLIDWRYYTNWSGVSTAQQIITIDCGVPVYADALGLASYSLPGGTVQVQASADNFSGEVLLVLNPIAPSSPAQVFPFPGITRRYWRVVINNLTGVPVIGIMCLGNLSVFQNPVEGSYAPADETPNFVQNLQNKGQLLGVSVLYNAISTTANIPNVDQAWYVANLKTWWDEHLSRGLPFFYVPDFFNRQNEVFLYRIPSGAGLNAPFHGSNRRNVTLTFAGVKN